MWLESLWGRIEYVQVECGWRCIRRFDDEQRRPRILLWTLWDVGSIEDISGHGLEKFLDLRILRESGWLFRIRGFWPSKLPIFWNYRSQWWCHSRATTSPIVSNSVKFGVSNHIINLCYSSIPSIDQSAIFTTDMTGHFPMFEGQCADNLFRWCLPNKIFQNQADKYDSNGAYVSEDFLFSNDLYASTNSLVLPEKKVPRAVCSPPMAMSCHASRGLKRISDAAIRRHKSERAVCYFPGCGVTFSRESDIPRHIKTAHGRKERYSCDFPGCTKSFSRRDKVTNHRRMHGLGCMDLDDER